MAKHNLYDSTPEMSRGDDGNVSVKKPEKKPAEKKSMDKNKATPSQDGGDMDARHSMDRHMLHAKMEHEHAMHKGSDKSEIHARHVKEAKQMFSRHEKDAGAMGGEGTDTSTAKLESKGAKA